MAILGKCVLLKISLCSRENRSRRPKDKYETKLELPEFLKELSHGGFSYLGHLQNYLLIEGNLKIILY